MDKEFFKGKTIRELADENTIILEKDGFVEGFEPLDVTIRDVEIHRGGPYLVMGDYLEGFVLCFQDDKLKAVFYVYELQHVSLNEERSFVKAQGHETIHEYWFDNDEYNSSHTR